MNGVGNHPLLPQSNVGHEPHMLFKVFKMPHSPAQEGTVKIDNWN